MDEARFLMRVDQLKLQVNDENCTKPEGRDAFAYGHVVGISHGILMARNLFIEMIKEDRETDT